MSPVLYREFQERRERDARAEELPTDRRDVVPSKRPRAARTVSNSRGIALGVGVAMLVMGLYAAPSARPQLPTGRNKPAASEASLSAALLMKETMRTASTPQTTHEPERAAKQRVPAAVPAAARTSSTTSSEGDTRMVGRRPRQAARGTTQPKRPRIAPAPATLRTPTPNGAVVGSPEKDTPLPARQAAAPDESWRITTVAAVESAIAQWSSTLQDADLYGHITLYGDRLERYFTARNVPWHAVYRDKRRLFLIYPVVVQYRIHNLQVVPESSDRAVALFDKSWDFRMIDNRRFAGEERQRLTLHLRDGRWRIVAEEELEVYWVVLPN